MWPWGHLAAGYLLYSLGVRLSGDRPRDYPTLALAFGTQFPDLVDKPLAWTLGVLPNGRSLTHSLLTAAVLLAVLRVVLGRRGYGSVWAAFGVGYLSHIAGDVLVLVATDQYYFLGFLVWPLVPGYGTVEKNIFGELSRIDPTALPPASVALAAAVFALWAADGLPGLRPVLALPRRAYRQLSAH